MLEMVFWHLVKIEVRRKLQILLQIQIFLQLDLAQIWRSVLAFSLLLTVFRVKCTVCWRVLMPCRPGLYHSPALLTQNYLKTQGKTCSSIYEEGSLYLILSTYKLCALNQHLTQTQLKSSRLLHKGHRKASPAGHVSILTWKHILGREKSPSGHVSFCPSHTVSSEQFLQ